MFETDIAEEPAVLCPHARLKLLAMLSAGLSNIASMLALESGHHSEAEDLRGNHGYR